MDDYLVEVIIFYYLQYEWLLRTSRWRAPECCMCHTLPASLDSLREPQSILKSSSKTLLELECRLHTCCCTCHTAWPPLWKFRTPEIRIAGPRERLDRRLGHLLRRMSHLQHYTISENKAKSFWGTLILCLLQIRNEIEWLAGWPGRIIRWKTIPDLHQCPCWYAKEEILQSARCKPMRLLDFYYQWVPTCYMNSATERVFAQLDDCSFHSFKEIYLSSIPSKTQQYTCGSIPRIFEKNMYIQACLD